MSDAIALKGMLQRRKDFIAVLDAGSEYAGKCKRGLEALVRIEGHPTAYRGKISQVNQSGGGYHVEIPLTRAPANLRIGTAVQATVYADTATAALIVPWAAVDRQGQICIWLVDFDKKAKRVPVNLGAYDDNLVAIYGDVKKDDWVILSPHNALSDNRDLDVSEVY
jgi:multidrug efflux pump subunit AcrA (membrane-fusion protein)